VCPSALVLLVRIFNPVHRSLSFVDADRFFESLWLFFLRRPLSLSEHAFLRLELGGVAAF